MGIKEKDQTNEKIYDTKLDYLIYIEEKVIYEADLSIKRLTKDRIKELFTESATSRKLFKPNSLYYTVGWRGILDDFKIDIRNKLGGGALK